MEKAVVTDDRGASGSAGTDEEVYSAAFDEKAGENKTVEEKSAEEPVKKDKEAIEDPPKKQPVPDDKQSEKPAKAEESDSSQDQDKDKVEQKYRTLQGIHKHDKEEWQREKSELLLALEEAKKPKQPEPSKEQQKKAEAFLESLTPEQKAELDAYDEEFDVVSKMEGLKRERAIKALKAEVDAWKQSIEAELKAAQAKIEPMSKVADTVQKSNHFEAIRLGYDREDGEHVNGHPDFKKYVKDGSILKWIESKPSYLRAALMKTYSDGTVEDAIDLLTDFKKETGIETQEEELETASSAEVISIEEERDKQKQMKKKALREVNGRPAAVNTGRGVAADYDSAFDEAVKKRG